MHATTLRPYHTKFTAPESTGVFLGLASTFGGEPDAYGDVVTPGAFAKTIEDHKARGTKPAMLWSHTQHEPIGTWLDMRETDQGLEVVGSLAMEVAKAREAHALMKQGALALSMGYRIEPGGWHRDAKGIRHLDQVDLIEVSPVALPANRNARITQVKSACRESPRDFELAVREALGLSAREAKRLCANGWSAMVRDEPATADEATLQAIAAQLKSITQKLRQS